MRLRLALGGLTAAAALFVTACNGSNSTPTPVATVPTATPVATAVPTATPVATATPAPTATPTPAPTASPTPAVLVPSIGTVSLTSAGAPAQVTVTENGYSGPLNAANGTPSCSGIATFSPASASGPSATFTVTAVAAGQCTIVVTDNHGGSVGINVSVTTTTGTINTAHRQTQ